MAGLTVHGLQFDLAWEDAAANRQTVAERLAAQAPEAGSLVVLPELFTSGFTMNAAAVAEAADGPTHAFLSRTAGAAGCWVVAGLAVRGMDGRVTNQAVVHGPKGELVGRYSKQRPFTPGGEAVHYQAGSGPFLFRWGLVTVAPFICYDLRFPELFREAARRGRPELYVVIANWPEKRIGHWLKLLQARAIENQAYVLGVNRVGADPSHLHPGRSVVANPWGDVVADAGEAAGFVTANLDMVALRDYRTKLPFLADLRDSPC